MALDGIFLTDFAADKPGLHQRQLGPYHMAAILRNRGMNVRVLDFIYSIPNEILDLWLKKYVSIKTRFVGISSTFLKFDSPPFYPNPNKDRITEILLKLRVINPSIQIIQGAPVVYYKHPLCNQYFDGTGIENRFLSYLNEKFKFGLKEDFDFNRELITFSEDDLILKNETLPVEISRGCIFSCKFCGFSGRGKKKNEAVKDFSVIGQQMETHYKLFEVKNYFLADDTFNESVDKISNFRDMVKTLSFKPQFVCYARLDLIWAFPEMIEIMYELGIRAIIFGIETLSQKAGIAIGKGLGKQKIENTLKLIRKKYPDLYLASGFIVGLPFESLHECEETNSWLLQSRLLDSWSFYPLRIDSVTHDPFKSDFSKNIENYGYTRVGASGWKRPDLDSKDCEELALKLNAKNSGFVKPFPWYFFEALRRYTKEELLRSANISELCTDTNKFSLYIELLKRQC